MYKEFDNRLKQVLKILEDKTIKEDYKIEIIDSFCETYIYFDSSKFDKYLN